MFKSHFQKENCIFLLVTKLDFHFLKLKISFSAFQINHSVQNQLLYFPLGKMEISFVKIWEFKQFTPFYFGQKYLWLYLDIN